MKEPHLALADLLAEAKAAHTKFEATGPAPHDWTVWYAQWMMVHGAARLAEAANAYIGATAWANRPRTYEGITLHDL